MSSTTYGLVDIEDISPVWDGKSICDESSQEYRPAHKLDASLLVTLLYSWVNDSLCFIFLLEEKFDSPRS